MSGTSRPRGRPLGSGGKSKSRVTSDHSSLQQRNVTQYMTQSPPNTSAPSSSNAQGPINTSPMPSPTVERTPTPEYHQQPPNDESETVPLTQVGSDHNNQPQETIPFADPTLPGPHNTHLPWGKDPSDNKVWTYPLRGYFYPDDNATKDISKAIKSVFDGPYNNWKRCNDEIKLLWFNEWAKKYKWIGEHESTIKAMWESKAKDLLRKIMARARENISSRPSWILDNVWPLLLAIWEDEDYQTLRCVASANRHSDTGGSLHTQGSMNQFKHELELAKSLGRMPNKGEIFQKCHLRKGTQTFVDKRSSDSYDNYLNLCSQAESQSQAGDGESSSQPKPIDYDALMIEAVGGRNAKGMVYGLSLDGRMRAKALTSKSQYANYSDIVRGMSAEVEAKLKQKITEQQQTIDNISATIARQNKMIALFARHANIDLDAMDLDEDNPHDVPGSDASNNNMSDE